MQIGQALSQDVRPGRQHCFLDHPDDRSGRPGQDGEGNCESSRKTKPTIPRRRMRHRKPDNAKPDQPISHPDPRITMARHRLEGCPNRRQRRHLTHSEQGQQREQETDHESHSHGLDHRAPRCHEGEFKRKKITDSHGHRLLNEHAQRATNNRPDESNGRSLHEVNRHRLRRRRSQASQHRHGVELLADVDVDRAGHPHRAQQQGDKTHQVQKVVEVFHRATQTAFPILHRLNAEPTLIQLWPNGSDDLGRICRRRELEVNFVTRETALA